jgi:hypothetical protein
MVEDPRDSSLSGEDSDAAHRARRALLELRCLYEAFPDTATAQEAVRQAGLDPTSLPESLDDLTDEDVRDLREAITAVLVGHGHNPMAIRAAVWTRHRRVD